MMTPERPERRARTVALAGLVFQIALAVFLAILTSWSQSEAMRALTLLAAGGNLIWLFLVLVYHQRVLVQEEALETEQLRRERESGSGTAAIFDVADEQLLLARRRLDWMYRWLLSAFTFVFVALLVVAGLGYWSWGLRESLSSDRWTAVQNAGGLIWFVGGAAFLSFLLSRYATGMARQPEWRMLHAGAAYLMGMTLSAAVLAAALGALHFFPTPTPIPERVVAYGLRCLLLVLAGETTLNFVLDFYRPRAAGEEPRPAFDSRLLGLFTEPGGIARSIAEAINYQFGFEVSSTWFYKLLQRSVVPLIGFAAATLFAASSFLFVSAEDRAVIELFGQKSREVGPGLHLKWPWPIEMAYQVTTARVHELKIGIRSEQEPQAQEELILWTTKHEQEPHLTVLVATPKLASFLNVGEPAAPGEQGLQPQTQPGEDAGTEQGEAVPVSQLRVSVTLQYEIRDAYEWLRTYADPEAMLAAIAEREITRYCASTDVASLLGGQRGPIEQALWRVIQKSADDGQLGVDIVFLGLQGVHPPTETAEAFQDVIGAESKRTASVRSATKDRNKRLSEVAGNVDRAEQLARVIREINELQADPNAPADRLQAARDWLHALFFGDAERNMRPVGGLAAEKIMRARQKRWQLENLAHGKAAGFDAEIVAKNAAPSVYRMRRYLETLAKALPGVRKYVMAADGLKGVPTFHLNLQDARDIPLDVALEKKEE